MPTRLRRALLAVVVASLGVGCESDGGGVTGGDDGGGFLADATVDAGPPPPVRLASVYALDDDRTTCAARFSWWATCVVASRSGDELMLYAADHVVTGEVRDGGVALAATSLADEAGDPVPVDGCLAAAGPRSEDEPLVFTCRRDGAPCTLAFEPTPDCFGAPRPAVLTDSVVEPDQLFRVSRYNSCVGHDWGCPLIEGCFASLKHYLYPAARYVDTNDAVGVFAPCDGFVARLEPEQHRPGCLGGEARGQQLRLMCDHPEEVTVVLFHVNPAVGVEQDTPVLAGDHLGFADVRGCGDPTPSFDVAVFHRGVAVFPFAYMDAAAFAAWRAWGVPDPPAPLRLDDEERGVCDFGEPPPRDHWFVPE